jgi:glutathione synthase
MAIRPVVLGVVMDPISTIKPHKDSTFAMLLAARSRGWELRYMELADLALHDGAAVARWRPLQVHDRSSDWWELGEPQDGPMAGVGGADGMDVILMRKDPPFDSEYVAATYILECAMDAGALVVNHPRALRDVQEKVSVARFPECAPPTLVTRDAGRLRAFLAEHGRMVLKPLDGMGGTSIFVVGEDDPNLSVVIEVLTDHGERFAIAQRYLPEISQGDKRILLVAGEPVPHALARVPAPGESRGNLAAGGHGVVVPLSDRDRWICEQVAAPLLERGLLFVGLDVIGDYLTEINVTSPTCIREIDAATGSDIAAQLMDAVEARIRR